MIRLRISRRHAFILAEAPPATVRMEARVRIPALPLAALALAILGAPPPAAGQTVAGPLPPSVEEAAFQLLNAGESFRLAGGRIPVGTRVEGDVAVLGGSLELGGEIAGALLVVNGDLELLPGAEVEGSTLVLGGAVLGESEAVLEGGLAVYSTPLRYQVENGNVEPVQGAGPGVGLLASDLGFGRARLSIRSTSAYNRVEGLPVRFGAIVGTAGRNPLALEASGIWRSVSGLTLRSDRLGHNFGLAQAVGGRGTAEIAARAYDEFIPIEERGLSDVEASLSTFLLREDLRDYYRRRGWSVSGSLRPVRPPIELVIGYRQEDHQTAPVQGPWTLGDSETPWRPLPLVAEGRSRSVEGVLRWDSRDDPSVPADGWLISLALQAQIGGSLSLPPTGRGVTAEAADAVANPTRLSRFNAGTLDIRRYARVGPTSRLKLRALFQGGLEPAALVPQLQSALGGEGTLPGHPRFSIDCAARADSRFARTGGEEGGRRTVVPVFLSYGCDRTVLFQAEFQGALPLSGNPLPDGWQDSELGPLFNIQPVWAVFLNAGRGWELGSLSSGGARSDSPTRADIGVGLFLGSVGAYWSYPLNRSERGLDFFLRLQQRF